MNKHKKLSLQIWIIFMIAAGSFVGACETPPNHRVNNDSGTEDIVTQPCDVGAVNDCICDDATSGFQICLTPGIFGECSCIMADDIDEEQPVSDNADSACGAEPALCRQLDFASSISRFSSKRSYPVVLHVVRTDDGETDFRESYMDPHITQTNEHFAELNVEFYIEEIRYIDRTDLLVMNQTDEMPENNLAELMRSFGIDNRINIFIPSRISADGRPINGIGRFPCWDSQSIALSMTQVIDRSSTTLSHELGHFLGLYHTHQSAGPTRVTSELVDHSNCRERADLVCDTPADPGPWHCSYTGSCGLHCSATDASGARFAPDARNLMSYYRPSCGDEPYFTEQQIDRMRCNLDTVLTGLRFCVGGPCDDSCTPSAEVCDSADNDCDGGIDEGACSIPLEAPQLTSPSDRHRVEVGQGVSFGWTRSTSHPSSPHSLKIARCADSSCTSSVGGPVFEQVFPGSSGSWTPTSTGWYRWVAYVEEGGVQRAPMYRTIEVTEARECSEGASRSCTTSMPGVCMEGRQSCVGGSWGSCNPDTGPSPEICFNGIDEDCDGTPDDGCTVSPPVLRSPSDYASYDEGDSIGFRWDRSSSAPTLDHSLKIRRCVTDRCSDPARDATGPVVHDRLVTGTSSSVSGLSAGWYRWVVYVSPGDVAPMYRVVEVRAPECSSGMTMSCDTGSPGICRDGERSCFGGSWGSCRALRSPSEETCGNGMDDDCNGATDECCRESTSRVPSLRAPSDGRFESGSVSFAWRRASGGECLPHYLKIRECITAGCTDPSLDASGRLVYEREVSGESTTVSGSTFRAGRSYRWVVYYGRDIAPMYWVFRY